jgi:hypothetical protein
MRAQMSSINYQPRVEWIKGKASNVYTQFGEDGLIDACLDYIGTTNRQAFEIGAADGRFYSNTLRLREQGWRAVLIEAGRDQYDALQREYGTTSVCIHETCTDLDETLNGTGIHNAPDLGIIDIDGQDYWLWHDLRKYRPRVMLVEIFPPDPRKLPPDRGAGPEHQAGLDPIRQLGTEKGYTLVATTHCNALFIDKAELDKAELNNAGS